MVRRLLSRKAISGQRLESMLASVEERGSAYFPELNAFCNPRISIGACSRGCRRLSASTRAGVCRIG